MNDGTNTVTPTIINSNLIEISEVKKSSSSNMNAHQYENFILYNLIKNNSPDDISINSYSIPSDVDINNTRLTIQPNDPYNLKHHTIINNDDSLIQSEKFALSAEYIDKQITTEKIGDFVIVGPNNSRIVDSNITLTNRTISYYDSNLKFDISFNNDIQYTDNSWCVQFDRKYNYMNYYAAINSHLNTQNGEYPFRIYEDISINKLSLGVDGHYFLPVTNTATDYNRRVIHKFVDDANLVNYTLAKNNLELITNNITNFDFSRNHFGTYKIEQTDSSNITTVLTYNGQNATNNDIITFPIETDYGTQISTDLFTFQYVSGMVNRLHPENSSKITSGFTATLDISGGKYDCSSNDHFSIDDTDLTVDGSDKNLNYFKNSKSNNRHYVEILNGSVTLSDNSNVDLGYITLSSDAETLESPYHTKEGNIEIKTTYSSERVENLSGNLVNEINIYYNTSEGSNISVISDNLRVASDVSYNMKLLVESTTNPASVTYGTNDKRNLATNTLNNYLNDSSNSRLVIANDTQPLNFDIRSETDFKFLDEDPTNKIRQPNKINILNIQNENILVEEGLLSYELTSNGDVDTTSIVSGTSCDVALVNTPLDNMQYSDYRIKLVTKNANDLNTPTNGWTFDLTPYKNDSLGLPDDVSGILIGNSSHQSEIINDVFSFLNGNTPINIQYNLNVESTASTLNNIKYYFGVSSNGETYSFGYNDTQFEYDSVNDTFFTEVTSSSVIGLNKENYIFEKWLRRKAYKATLDPSLPFYENLILKTPSIYEENEYYRAWKKNGNNKGAEISPIALQSFKIGDVTMNIVNVKLVENFNSTSQLSNLSCAIELHPNDCKIFKAKLQGKDLINNIWNDLESEVAHIDPYIKQDGTITNTSSSLTFNCNLRVAFSLNVYVIKPNYYINITNPLTDSSNFNMTARLYSLSITDISNNPNLIDAFSPYKSTFTDSIIENYETSTNYICDLYLNTQTNKYTLTISHLVDGISKKDVEINFPKDFVLNFGIINSENLFSVNRTIDSNTSFLGYKFNNFSDNQENEAFKVEDGVYLTLLNNNLVMGEQQTFSLIRDQVKVNFVDDPNYIPTSDDAKSWGETWQTIQLDSNNQQIASNTLTSDSTIDNTHGGTKSVIFHKTRGYYASNNIIKINRTATVYKFILDASNTGIGGRSDGIENQIYEQTWEDGVTNNFRIGNLESKNSTPPTNGLWQNNVVGSNDRVHLDIGLVLKINQSILADSEDVTVYDITPIAASYNYKFKNPIGATEIVNGSGNGSLFDVDANGVLTNFFDLKVRSLKTQSPIQIKITYLSSKLEIFFNSSYTSKPDEINWETPICSFTPGEIYVGNPIKLHPSDNTLDAGSYPISLKKTAEKIGRFISYFVCAPPSFGIEFNSIDSNINSLPFNQSNITRTTVHIDATTRNNNSCDLYNIVGSTKIGNHTTVRSPNLDLQVLKTTASNNIQNIQNVKIKGNYLKLSIYSGLKRPDASMVTIYVDSSSNPSGTSEVDSSYNYYVFTDSSNSLIGDGEEFNGTIDDILNSPTRNADKFSVIMNNNKYDISYSQPLNGITEIKNDTYNIEFIIDNAFIPANVSYLPLPTNKSTAVSLYNTSLHYGFNGNYFINLIKYHLSDDAGVDYNALLAPNSNIRQVSFRLNKISRKSILLYMLDNSNGRVLINPINLSDASNVTNLLDNLNVNDLSGEWHETSLNGVRSVGISLAALDVYGKEGIRDLLQNKPFHQLTNKTLFIRRADILRVLSAVGNPVLRITNSGNIITPKVTTSIISLLQQSVTTGGRNISYGSEAVSSGLFSEGALDFSGNWLDYNL